MQHNNVTTANIIKGSDILLHDYGQMIAHGKELNSPQRLIAISQSRMVQSGEYGPTPETFQVKQMDLPESTKGVLADYAG